MPGAALGVLVDDEVHELGSGVLNRATGVEVTPGSLFLSGSLAKAYTATAVMVLVDRGDVGLDTRVRELLPDFATPDEAAAEQITVRQLLSHTSGLTCDFMLDTGRGDDCLEKYVAAVADVPLDCPPATALSYSSVGYAVLGRILEVITGRTWDAALAELLLEPAGLAHTVTLPEEALRFRTALGHLDGEPADTWDLMPRAAGPFGRVVVSAGDVVRFARLHLRSGRADDGSTVLSAASVTAMQERQVDAVDRWTFFADAWGLGWALYDWDGVAGFGHDGSAVTQQSYLRVVPQAGVAVALLVNSDVGIELYDPLVRELLEELAGVHTPPLFAAPSDPPEVDLTPFLGVYERAGVRTSVERDDRGGGRLVYELTGAMAGYSDPLVSSLVPVDDRVFAAVGGFGPQALPVIFGELPDGTPIVTVSMRVTPRVT